MSKYPQITVLMPVYNVSAFVTEAVKSILNQTYTDFELLIINDGSTDKTWDEVLKITDKRILLVENEKNIGLANTLNRGVELARGKYIARMDGDDISMPDRLEKQYKLLENNPDIDFGNPGPLVHFLEIFYKKGYEKKLVESLKRQPTKHTVWMLNRIINGSEKEIKNYFINVLLDVLKFPNISNDLVLIVKQFNDLHK